MIPRCILGYHFLTLRIYKGPLTSKRVKIRSIRVKSKTTLRYQMFCILTHMTSRSHQRSLEVTGGHKEVKFGKCTQGLNFWHSYPYYIPDQNRLCHFDPKIDKRLLDVKMRFNLKTAPRNPFFCKHTHMISLINIG